MLKKYQIIYKKSAKKYLMKIPPDIHLLVVNSIALLENFDKVKNELDVDKLGGF